MAVGDELYDDIYQSWNQQKPMNGWNTKQTVTGTTKIKCSFREDMDTINRMTSIEFDEMLYRKLTDGLVKELFKNDYVQYSTEQHPGFESYREYQATINVAEQRFNTMIIDERVFMVNDIEFTPDKIKEALIKTFPEEFL